MTKQSETDRKKPELLAPAGDYTCFQAAIKAGADAVYLGGRQFGARAFAGNFPDEELLEALKEAHFWGRKIYLTINTLLKQEELVQLPDYLEPFYRNGLDGVIIQDLGVLKLCRECFPGLELHSSTQMTVTDVRAALELKELGVCRVVPARELSVTEMSAIRRYSGLEVEAFIHGAMCYSYSGQCLFSSLLGGRSGNRGRCAQPCRQPYRMECGGQISGECYPLSLKDMCTISFLPELIEAGIDSFKIEGRMKRPEYVAGVTGVYRKYIDEYFMSDKNGTTNRKIQEADMRLLSSLYIRSEVGEGYYHRHNGREMVTLNQPGYAGCDESVLDGIRKQILDHDMTRPVNFRIILRAGHPARLEAEAGSYCVTVSGQPVQNAQKRPLCDDDISKQLARTGGSGFHADRIVIDKDPDIFMPVSALNELRRDTLERLKSIISNPAVYEGRQRRIEYKISYAEETYQTAQQTLLFHVSVADFSQFHIVKDRLDIARVYFPADLFTGTIPEWVTQQIAGTSETNTEYFLSLPPILKQADEIYLQKLEVLLAGLPFAGVRVSSLSQYRWMKEVNTRRRSCQPDAGSSPALKISLDHRCYIWNRESMDAYPETGTWCAPLELNRKAVYNLAKSLGNRYGYPELMVYGRIPMMTSANCIRRTSDTCIGNTGSSGITDTTLLDRYKTIFPVEINCRHCYNVIYNSVPLSLHSYMEELEKRFTPYLAFTDENPKQISEILDRFAGMNGSSHGIASPQIPDNSCQYTTGHFKKGAH